MEGFCKECESKVDVKRLPDGPDFCPECRSVDTIDFDYDPTPWCSGCGAMTRRACGCGDIVENN